MKHKIQRTSDRLVGYKKVMLAAAGLLMLTLLALTLPAPEAQAERPHDRHAPTLAGSWRIEVTDAPGSSFLSYETFSEAGGSVEINERGGPQPSIGAWKRIGPRKFLATFYKPISKPASEGPFPFEPDFTVKVRRLITLSLDGSELTGVATLEVFDPAGNLVSTAPPHTLVGTRVVAEMPDL